MVGTSSSSFSIAQYSLNLCFTAKFNCTVPGTLYDFIEECNITTMVKTPAETASVVVPTTITSISVHTPTNVPPTYTSFGTIILIPLLTSLIGDVVIAVILAISITIICVLIRFKVGRSDQPIANTPSSTVTNTRPQAKLPGKR